MTRLSVYSLDGGQKLDTRDPACIAGALAPLGVRFEQWPARPLPADADPAAVLDAFAPEVARLQAENGYRTVDVIRMTPDHPERAALRAKFLSEHRHSEDEVRFFVEGAGLFMLRDDAHVHAVLCEAGDLISVPAGMRHWFDMGPHPRFTAIRLFIEPAGWVADFTGDAIADRFPRHEPV
ncbi:1,2-dihydroxy-3-keto-5-methylthiopentene dioxygenase [Sphingomonas naasensis]|uniref:Acireductone dioxygenase n=1 Tax=Sphingomonas naasensis TaxID=1344951 RepID=A0A4V3QXE8_9SPHN|nr:cupin domain-containing protein [Sphingomonas naasensis]NIJ19030.1 1,2-dihydroxy-3-keto-5-methylthiopentene dioxygenase [Sphingomonas naasensis]TGX46232.1 cupin domain-containing protein [Sphingomonas naasensis]